MEEKLTTVSEETGTWCWHVHIATKSSKKLLHATRYIFSSVGSSWREHVKTSFRISSTVCCTQEHDGDDPFYIREFHIPMRHYVY